MKSGPALLSDTQCIVKCNRLRVRRRRAAIERDDDRKIVVVMLGESVLVICWRSAPAPLVRVAYVYSGALHRPPMQTSHTVPFIILHIGYMICAIRALALAPSS